MAEKKDSVAKKEEVVRDENTGRVAEVHQDEIITDPDHELAVQVPDEVNRDADDFDNTRSDPSPAQVFADQAKSSKSSSSSKSE